MITVNRCSKSVVAFIFARGGSKSVPRKNLLNLAGKPLIAHAIICALSSKYVDRVIVSTDDPEIAEVSKKFGAEVPFIRPAELASDLSSEWLSWQHALTFLRDKGEQLDVFLSVPATAPMREVADLNACVDRLMQGDVDLVITASEATHSPYFNIVKIVNGLAELALKPDTAIFRRQDAPKFFDVTTVAYAAKPSFILEKSSVFDGSVGVVIIPEERALDIDTLLDFKIADFLMRERLRESLDEKY